VAQSGNRKQFLVSSTGCAFKVLRISSLKFLRFFFKTKTILILSFRVDGFGGAAGGDLEDLFLLVANRGRS
jgi:hypothetical protein